MVKLMVKKICECFAVFLAVLFLAFCVFLADVVTYDDEYPARACENMVVLTGGRHRISYMLHILSKHQPANILVSGVHEKTSLRDIFGNVDLKGINVALGRQAKNTAGNAVEVSEWAKANGIHSIILITSDYHMRRGISELRHVNPNLKIFPCAVKSQFNWYFLQSCSKEFYRMIYVYWKNF